MKSNRFSSSRRPSFKLAILQNVLRAPNRAPLKLLPLIPHTRASNTVLFQCHCSRRNVQFTRNVLPVKSIRRALSSPARDKAYAQYFYANTPAKLEAYRCRTIAGKWDRSATHCCSINLSLHGAAFSFSNSQCLFPASFPVGPRRRRFFPFLPRPRLLTFISIPRHCTHA